MLFSNKDIKKLILPLFVEQLLAVAVGLADSIMVAKVGESAVSAVSLVDSISVLIINIFAALATGGAVVAGQYIGKKKNKDACESTEQLLAFSLFFSIIVMILLYILKHFVLTVVFGKIDSDVYRYSNIYYMIVNLSIPFIAIYNSGAAIFRTMGNTRLSMKISFEMNMINVVGNAILIYGFKLGVEGVAIPTLVSRMVAAVIIIMRLRNQSLMLHISKPFKYKYNSMMIRKILHIGIPSGIENSMFQLGKILLLSVVAGFGTHQIAANAISNTLASFEILPAATVGLAIVTVISRCVGAGDYKQAEYYAKKLMKLAYLSMAIINIAMTLMLPVFMRIYNVSGKTESLAIKILVMHGICAIFIWPSSFTVPNILRASNDVKYTMVVGVMSMWFCRIVCAVVLAKTFNLGAMGVWIAMIIDWGVRSVFFCLRYKSKKWQLRKLV